ncbi:MULTISPECIES: LysM peptidoglycan-binding domain-containing protein [Anaerolinea]|uniref:LysM peptidoglycan-binding domain-containing protein n=1 Tax=Anaerolinea TaxID=233189 RepID=UPI002606204B|nr:LysM peptidoglycan-binding domain-containing protein [Anaerolinea thermophila]
MKIRLGGNLTRIWTTVLITFLLSGCVRGMNGAGQSPFSFGQKSQFGLVETLPSVAEQNPGLPTSTSLPQITPTPKESPTPAPPILYYTQAGDTLNALAARFDVSKEEITSTQTLPETGLLDPGILLIIPHRLGETTSSEKVMPDSEIVFSPSALDFDINQYVTDAGGYLTTIQEWHTNGWNSGAASVYKVAIDNSINPRLLLAILEYQSHWVTGQPANLAQTDFPIGYLNYQKKGLFAQLSWAVQQLNIGYYGWREGRLTTLTFQDGTSIRLAPDLNAGSVAILYLFSQLYDQPHWAAAVYGPDSMPALYEKMFGNPWLRAQSVEPLFPATLTQPPMELPFRPGKPWSLTGGPHSAWGPDGARAALDFAPSTTEKDCYVSSDWVTAISSGLVVRSEYGVVVVDLDGDGFEQTGWAVLYLHIATDGRVPANTWVNTDDRIGHPSCEGGQATGTHVHIARKYNGEWILADGPMPFILSGWRAIAGEKPYQGALVKDGQTVKASIYGDYSSLISR